MATKKEELEKAARGEGCLGRAADDEPIFILRAQDKLAPALIEEWAERLYAAAPFNTATEKIDEARALATKMRMWQVINHSKVPD